MISPEYVLPEENKETLVVSLYVYLFLFNEWQNMYLCWCPVKYVPLVLLG